VSAAAAAAATGSAEDIQRAKVARHIEDVAAIQRQIARRAVYGSLDKGFLVCATDPTGTRLPLHGIRLREDINDGMASYSITGTVFGGKVNVRLAAYSLKKEKGATFTSPVKIGGVSPTMVTFTMEGTTFDDSGGSSGGGSGSSSSSSGR